MTAIEKTRNLVEVITRLNALLERENAGLKAMQVGQISGLTDEKQRLARLYEQLGGDLVGAQAEIAGMPQELRDALRDAGTRLEVLTRENAIRLKAAMTANQRLFDIVREAAERKRYGAGTYTHTGAIKSTGTGGGKPVALSLNQTL
ncbi:MAG: hypothetical protein WD270_06080 [Acetobacterales bacterium]